MKKFILAIAVAALVLVPVTASAQRRVRVRIDTGIGIHHRAIQSVPYRYRYLQPRIGIGYSRIVYPPIYVHPTPYTLPYWGSPNYYPNGSYFHHYNRGTGIYLRVR